MKPPTDDELREWTQGKFADGRHTFAAMIAAQLLAEREAGRALGARIDGFFNMGLRMPDVIRAGLIAYRRTIGDTE